MKRIVVGITGASGSIYGIRLLEVLRELKLECHLVVSRTGLEVIKYETGYDASALKQLAAWHDIGDLFAPIASGSFRSDGMIIAPCSMHSLGAIAQGITGNLMTRAADVMLKENRPLILVTRETPLNKIHLANMAKVMDAGARLVPASPGFYHKPTSLQEIVDFVVGKAMDSLGLEHNLFRRWGE
ncbi:MAG TPA: UbiX family flavin prenyltransferase [Candidatus Deferrimicrobium sp.]|nr:UbiX family flavin prenyltransferase [Candidatus Deferrimicrobium sp.]